MAKKVKVMLVNGSIVTRNQVRVSTLPDEIEKSLQGFYSDDGIKNLDIKTEVKWDSAASGGAALLIVTYEGQLSAPKPEIPAEPEAAPAEGEGEPASQPEGKGKGKGKK